MQSDNTVQAAIARAVRMEQFTLRDGIYTRTLDEAISYPEAGNALCFQLEEDSFWFRHRNDVIRAVVDRLPPPGPLFDVGGGNGYVSAFLQAHGHPCALFEPGPQGAANARDRGLPAVFCALFGPDTIRPDTVAGIGLFDVLEHIEDDAAFLADMHGALAPGGRIYITVPAYQWLWSREDSDAGHYRRYTRKGLRNALRAAGFAVDFASYFFWFLPLPIFLFRRLLGGGRAGQATPPPQAALDRAQRAHHMPGPLARVAGWVTGAEARRIGKGRGVAFGGSLTLVGRKGEK